MRQPGPTYYGPGGPAFKDYLSQDFVSFGFPGRQAARQQEADTAYWFAQECEQADPETFEIKGHSTVSMSKRPAEDRSHVTTRRTYGHGRPISEIPEFAVVRVGKTTAFVVHTKTGIAVTEEMSIPKACAEQKRITEVMAQWSEAVA